jgi:hypothetical protein
MHCKSELGFPRKPWLAIGCPRSWVYHEPVVAQPAFFVSFNRRQKPSSSHHFSDNRRRLSHKRGKNPEKTSEKSIKSGGDWRFFEGQNAISTSVYTTGTVAGTNGTPGLTSASRAVSSDLLTANSKSERHFFGCDRGRRVADRGDMRVAPALRTRRRLSS